MARLFRKLFGSTRGAARRRRRAEARSLGVEHLDRRQMLSANAMASFADTRHGMAYDIVPGRQDGVSDRCTIDPSKLQVAKPLPAVAVRPTVSFSNGVLTVTGTSGADSVEVRQNGDRIEVVGADVRQPFSGALQRLGAVRGATNPFTVQAGTASLPASLVKQIKIDGGAGNDTIKVRTYEMSADLITKVSINAGAGNDRVEVGVDGAMAKKVFADLGNGTDTLELPSGVTLGTQKQAERVNYVAQHLQNCKIYFGELLSGEKLRHPTDLEMGVLRGTMEVQMGTLSQSLQVTRTTDGYTITQHESGCFNTTDSSVSISDADLAGPADMLTDAQKNALDALHRMLSAPQSTYGKWIGYDGPRTCDFQDSDGDGIDDRYQPGPGQPRW